MSHIRYLIANAIVEKLTEDLITDIDSSDPIRATIVKYGRFQDNPITNYLYVAVAGGNMRQPETNDGILTIDTMENIGLKLPPREIGGGTFWWRRGWVEVGCYFITQNLSETTVADYSHQFLGRVEESIETLNICGLIDEFGEKAHSIYVYGDNFLEGGGPPTQYLWRGQVLWQALTQRSV